MQKDKTFKDLKQQMISKEATKSRVFSFSSQSNRPKFQNGESNTTFNQNKAIGQN